MRKKLQYPSVSRVINVPVPYPVVPGGDFSDFDLIQSRKAKQLDSFTNTVYLPVAAVVFQPCVFTQFSEPQRVKQVQDFDFDDFYTTTTFVPGIFSQFEQPQPRKGFTYSFDDGWTGTGTPVQNFVFTAFSQPQVVKPQSPQVTFVGDRG